MKTLSFEKIINAPAHKVWKVLWGNETYGEWTKHFSPGSKMTSDWKVGGRTSFVNAAGTDGMLSTISKLNEPHELVFQAKGFLKDGVEDYDSEEVKKYAGALEGYRLAETDGVTTLTGTVDVSPEWEEHMRNGFEKGFDEVKTMAEQG